MARTDPTDCGLAVVLKLPGRHAAFLEQVFANTHIGLVNDLTDCPNQLRDLRRSGREARICEQVLAALGGALIEPDWEMLAMVRETAWANDESNGYERIVFEHRPFCALLSQIEWGGRH